MPVRGAKNVRRNISRQMRNLAQKGERAVTAGLIVIGNKALEYTPLDTSALQNSQDRIVRPSLAGWTGAIVYTQAYAAALHERDDWSPQKPGTPGKPNGGWNPKAKPGFLREAAEEKRRTVDRVVLEEMRV